MFYQGYSNIKIGIHFNVIPSVYVLMLVNRKMQYNRVRPLFITVSYEKYLWTNQIFCTDVSTSF